MVSLFLVYGHKKAFIGGKNITGSFFTSLCNVTPSLFLWIYALFNSSLNLSAIIAINSLFVGLPLLAETVYPKILSTTSCCPRPHATSIAWRIARSTRLGVVRYFM